MKRGARFITIALTSTVVVGAFLAAAAGSASAAAPKCFGKKATIVGTNKADVLKGTAKADVIVALGGNDKVTALSGNDLICGGSGNDKLYGGPGFDLIQGEVGTDQLFGESGADNLWGQEGNDTFNGGPGFNFALFIDAPNGVDVDLAAGEATGEGTDQLIAIQGVVGSDFDDTLVGDTAVNQFEGLEGNDTIDGGGGLLSFLDAVTYFNAAGPVTVDLTAGTATGAGTDTLSKIGVVHGGSFDDTVTGDANPNYIHGGDGNDTISSLDEDDWVFGEEGDDTIDAGNGNDLVDGGSGTDTCTNGEDVTSCP
jgi:Ca2+-binding RTX toxin-like protein